MKPYTLTWYHLDGSKTSLIFESLCWALTAKFAIEHDNANIVDVKDCNDKFYS